LLELASLVDCSNVVIEIGGIAARVAASDPVFLHMLENRYAGFISSRTDADFDFHVDLSEPETPDPDADVSVTHRAGCWSVERGDFRAEWEPATSRGTIRQSPNPYSIDAVLRILHSLVLAKRGGFLLHAASAIRNGKAFLFAGVSGAGKTTIAGLAPTDASLLTDEISYVRKEAYGYSACGTPFTGELEKIGENISAPVTALYLLAKGPANRIEPVPAAEAARALLSNILFFAKDQEMIGALLHSACEFVDCVPVSRLTFVPDSRVWGMIG
jgi:hypothetical protein